MSIDCVDWQGEYGSCSTTCGPGKKQGHISNYTCQSCGGQACPANDGDTEDTVVMNSCPVDCVGEWGHGILMPTCGSWNKNKKLFSKYTCMHGGEECPFNNGQGQTNNCNEKPSIDCGVG